MIKLDMLFLFILAFSVTSEASYEDYDQFRGELINDVAYPKSSEAKRQSFDIRMPDVRPTQVKFGSVNKSNSFDGIMADIQMLKLDEFQDSLPKGLPSVLIVYILSGNRSYDTRFYFSADPYL